MICHAPALSVVFVITATAPIREWSVGMGDTFALNALEEVRRVELLGSDNEQSSLPYQGSFCL